jgi:hypothetical protein
MYLIAFRSVVTLSLALLFFCTAASASDIDIKIDSDPETEPNQQTTETERSDLRIGISTIYSPDSFAAWGKIKNSQSVSFRGIFWHSSFSVGNLQARLGSELILSHHVNYPINGISGPEDSRLGIGFIPVNMLFPLSESKRINPFLFASAGGIFLNDKLPQYDGASLNYLLNIGGGFELPLFESTDIQIGYSIQHMSNANTGDQNPGIDSHSFFISIVL